MKIDLDKRIIGDGMYYITEAEAKELCKMSDPKGHHIPLLPKMGWSRKVSYGKDWYWIGLGLFNGSLTWTLKELD